MQKYKTYEVLGLVDGKGRGKSASAMSEARIEALKTDIDRFITFFNTERITLKMAQLR